LVAAGLAGTIALVMTGVGAVLVAVAAIYWFLISRGVLRWGALALAGLGLYVESAIGICATLVLAWPSYWLSAAEEDRRLREKYGATYETYRDQTWM
jgi:hypothetical protein